MIFRRRLSYSTIIANRYSAWCYCSLVQRKSIEGYLLW